MSMVGRFFFPSWVRLYSLSALQNTLKRWWANMMESRRRNVQVCLWSEIKSLVFVISLQILAWASTCPGPLVHMLNGEDF